MTTPLPEVGGRLSPEGSGTLSDKFGVPPFSVLDVRQGYWQKRKKLWNKILGENGESREETLFGENSIVGKLGTVSILDPVLAEILVSWFARPGAKCFDPFAGDTSFGFVAATKGYEFTGIELRPEQVAINQSRCGKMAATYICNDGQNVGKHIEAASQDFLFSCPPYFDLEIYSDRPDDASNQATYEDFFKILDKAFSDAIACLKENRFAAIVVSNIRDKKTGAYRNFVDDIIRLFQRNGMHFYNDIVLINAFTSGPLRAERNMRNRKVVKTHQNVLVFYKGGIDKIRENFPDTEVFIDNFSDGDENNDNGEAYRSAPR